VVASFTRRTDDWIFSRPERVPRRRPVRTCNSSRNPAGRTTAARISGPSPPPGGRPNHFRASSATSASRRHSRDDAEHSCRTTSAVRCGCIQAAPGDRAGSVSSTPGQSPKSLASMAALAPISCNASTWAGFRAACENPLSDELSAKRAGHRGGVSRSNQVFGLIFQKWRRSGLSGRERDGRGAWSTMATSFRCLPMSAPRAEGRFAIDIRVRWASPLPADPTAVVLPRHYMEKSEDYLLTSWVPHALRLPNF